MHFHRLATHFLVLAGAGLFLAGCNPATKGWASSKGESVSFSRLASAKQSCGYPQARRRAVNLLEADGNKQKNEHRAAVIMNTAEHCMKKYGVNFKRTAYGIGHLKSR